MLLMAKDCFAEGVLFQRTAPAETTSNGRYPSIAEDDSYIYITIGTNTWRRVAISTWASVASVYLIEGGSDKYLIEGGTDAYLIE